MAIDRGTPQAGEARPASHDDPGVWAPRLLRILDRQRDLYQRLDALSRTQEALIESDETDRLLEVLGSRQTLVDEIGALNEELSPFAERWDDLSTRLDPARRSALRARFDEVAALVGGIAERDEADRRRLESRRAAVGSQLNGLHNARGAVRAYEDRHRADQASPRFQDRTG